MSINSMKLLVLDPDKKFKTEILQNWSIPNTEIGESSGGSKALQLLGQGGIGVLFVSTDLLTIDNLDTLAYAREHNAGIEVYILAESGAADIAEKAVQRGAQSYFQKPVDLKVLEGIGAKAQSRSLTRQNYRYLEDQVLSDMFGTSPAMAKILKTLRKVSPTNSTILITGESGTGKEFLSSIVHRLSNRGEENFVTVNCGAIPDTLVESELFGAKKGSFTGSIADKKGLIEEADMGTLFLDEIGELSLSAQVKLLRFLQEKEIRRVGETENRYVNTRIIAATNRDLHQEIREGRFREDLFYRISTFHFNLPPLRDRKDTLSRLLNTFVKRFNESHHRNVQGIAKNAEAVLQQYDYPGNIRELQNIVEHAVAISEGKNILLEDLPEYLISGANAPVFALPVSTLPDKDSFPSLVDMEKEHIRKALALFDQNHTEVSKRLGISRSSLWRKMKEYKLESKNASSSVP